MHQIAAVATQLKEVASPAFRDYAKQVRANAAALAGALLSKGYVLTTGGTVNHLLVWDLRPTGLTGSKMQVICDACQVGGSGSCASAGVMLSLCLLLR